MKKYLKYIFGVAFLGIVFVLVGILSSNRIKVNIHDIQSETKITIGHFSDTHFDQTFEDSTYRFLSDTINQEEVDIILFTGDLFEVSTITEELEEKVIAFLSTLECTEKLAVLGNHDYFHGTTHTNQVIHILESSGFTVLVNESITKVINNQTIQFVGLDDLMSGNSDYDTILEEISTDITSYVLSHEPDTFDLVIDESIDAMFSGHSHGGQIRVPIIGDILKVPGAKKYSEHHYSINEKELYVSFGLGETFMKLRFFNPRQFEIYNYS